MCSFHGQGQFLIWKNCFLDVVAYARVSGFLGTTKAGAGGSFYLGIWDQTEQNSKTDLLRRLVEGRGDRKEGRKRIFRYWLVFSASRKAEVSIPGDEEHPSFYIFLARIKSYGSLRYRQTWESLSIWQAKMSTSNLKFCLQRKQKTGTQETSVISATKAEPGKKNLYQSWCFRPCAEGPCR